MKRVILRWKKSAYYSYAQGECLDDNGYYDFGGKFYNQTESLSLTRYWNGKGTRLNKNYTSSGIYICRIHPEKYGLVFTSKRKHSDTGKAMHFYKIEDKRKFLLFCIKYPDLIFFNPM